MENDTLKDVWSDFLSADKQMKPDLERRLVEHYFQLVKSIATRQHQKLSDAASFDDLVSNGVDGLYHAINNFDPNKGVKFETYAVHRIRGAMIDAIRQNDWVPRLVRHRATVVDNIRQLMESREGRALLPVEIAEKIGKSEKEFEHFCRSASSPALHSMNEMARSFDDYQSNLHGHPIERVTDEKTSQPSENLLRREFFDKLMGRGFTPQERKVVWLHYFEELSIKEISQTVNLSESRVSNMHSTILSRLRQKAELNPEYFKDISSVLQTFRDRTPKTLR